MKRHCPACGSRLSRKTSRCGIPREYCADCAEESPFFVPDGGEEPITDLARLQEGDQVRWDGRTFPLTVKNTTWGSHVIVEGPNNSRYCILATPDSDGPRLRLARGGWVTGLHRVEHTTDPQNRPTYEADWGVKWGSHGGPQ